jgi:hypothetical protein
MNSRIAVVPFSLRNLRDLEDFGSRFDGAPGLEFRHASKALGLGEWDVVRVPPGTWRGYEGGPDGLEILVFGAPHLGENPREDVEGQRDWWTDQRPEGMSRGVLVEQNERLAVESRQS